MPYRIAFLSKFPPIEGGIAAKTFWLSRGLAKRGYEVHVIAHGISAGGEYRIQNGENTPKDIPNLWIHWSSEDIPWHIPEDNEQTLSLLDLTIEIIRKYDIQIIDTGYMVPYGIIGNLAKLSTRVRHLLRHGGSDIEKFYNKGTWDNIILDTIRQADIVITDRNHESLFKSLSQNVIVHPAYISDEEVFKYTTDRTQESYQYLIRKHIIPSLGGIPLSELQPQNIQSYYAGKLKDGRADGKGGLSARSVVYHHRILSKALDYAVKMGLVVRNVAKVVQPPRMARNKMNTLSLEEVTRFLDAARETDYFVFFGTLLYTGLRRGELLALRWRYLDIDSGKLSVVETAYKLSNGDYIIKEPKTPHSRRTITLSTSLVELLKAYRADQELLRIQLGVTLDIDDFVFIRQDGSPINPNAVTLAFRRILNKAGLKGIRIHDLRHTHATLMLKAGIHPKVVSERLGHATVAFTLDTYSHVLPGLQEEVAEKFDAIFDGNANENSDPNVSKMLASGEEVESRPYRSRTCDTLIKSQKPNVPPHPSR